ncbi:RtcB family protein [Methylocaldum sp.]|uniref:RtcB family protein n=1 Tax=Methylocaldum sp. TaxID=1969727 RepID=UPI002D296CF2|nr:RtcB family protein [Methylocaldum sp.]HYE34362.1 RtcB family protein [Methylocaldum sp.]
MDISSLEKISDYEWRIPAKGDMRVPGVIYADEALVKGMDDKVLEQIVNVCRLPGIVGACYAMPDAHWGYGFPIGGVAAFDPEEGGVVSAGGVGFDISCGVRTLHTGLSAGQIRTAQAELADELYRTVPAGVGSTGHIRLTAHEMDAMLKGGACWAVDRGFGEPEDLAHIEESGCIEGARPECVSQQAKQRQRDEVGTLGSGNHYLEVQEVTEIYDPEIARRFGLREGDALVTIHCGSRGLGHQIGTDYLKEMVAAAAGFGIRLPDRELACAPIGSPLGQKYLGAMKAGMNCALANRQVITHLARQAFAAVLPDAALTVLYDVSHNTCKIEEHTVDGRRKRLYVHRKGATRAFGPGHPSLPEEFRKAGQPVIIGGSMGTASYILAGTERGEAASFSSACHGAGRAMSRHQATRQWRGRELVDALAEQGILIRSPSLRGVAEEAPGAYKDVSAVVEAADRAGLAKKVAKLKPIVCVKG